MDSLQRTEQSKVIKVYNLKINHKYFRSKRMNKNKNFIIVAKLCDIKYSLSIKIIGLR